MIEKFKAVVSKKDELDYRDVSIAIVFCPISIPILMKKKTNFWNSKNENEKSTCKRKLSIDTSMEKWSR